jgi:predicted nuclease of predicted toxin-antitoxin system
LKILIDVNLSPTWVDVLKRHSVESLHWTSIGDARATDAEILVWARDNGYVVFTHDLDFTTILALTKASGPSTIQVRTQDVTPSNLERVVVATLGEHRVAIETGAIVVVDEMRSRVRILPLQDGS